MSNGNFPPHQGPMNPGEPILSGEVLPAAVPEHPLAGVVGEIKDNTDKLVTIGTAGALATASVAEKVDTGNALLGEVHGAVDAVGDKVDTGFTDLGSKVDTGFSDLGDKVDTGFTDLGSKVDTGFSDLGDRVDAVGDKVDAGATHVGDRLDALADLMDERIPKPKAPMTPDDWFNMHLGVQAQLTDRDDRYRDSVIAQKAGDPVPANGFDLPPLASKYSQHERQGFLYAVARILGRSPFLRSISLSQLPWMDARRRGKGWLPPGSSVDAARDYAFNDDPSVGNASRRPRHHANAREAKDGKIADLAQNDVLGAIGRALAFGNKLSDVDISQIKKSGIDLSGLTAAQRRSLGL